MEKTFRKPDFTGAQKSQVVNIENKGRRANNK